MRYTIAEVAEKVVVFVLTVVILYYGALAARELLGGDGYDMEGRYPSWGSEGTCYQTLDGWEC